MSACGKRGGRLRETTTSYPPRPAVTSRCRQAPEATRSFSGLPVTVLAAVRGLRGKVDTIRVGHKLSSGALADGLPICVHSSQDLGFHLTYQLYQPPKVPASVESTTKLIRLIINKKVGKTRTSGCRCDVSTLQPVFTIFHSLRNSSFIFMHQR